MSSTLKWIGIVILVVILLLLIVPFLIPVNRFRPIIEQKASAALGRKVQLGDLSLSLLTGSLSVDNLSVSDDPKFNSGPFLTAKKLKVGVEMRPLIFSRQLNVTEISIDSPQVVMLKDPSGKWNFSSIGEASKNEPAAPPAPSAEQKGSSNPSPNPPASSSAESLSVKKLELKNGQITLGNTNSQKRSVYPDVNLTATDVSMASNFPVNFSMGLPGGGKMKIDGKMGPIDQKDAALTPQDVKLAVDDLNLASTGFLDPSLGLGGVVDMDAGLQSANGQMTTKGQVKISKAKLIAGGSPSSVPLTIDFDTKYDLPKSSGVLSPSTLKIGTAAAKINGTYKSQGDDFSVDLKVVGDNMPAKDLQGFMPAIAVNVPQGANLTTGTLNTNLHITGPTNRLVTDGNIGLFNATLAGFDLGSKMTAVTALTGLKSSKDLQIQKMTTNVHMAPNGLKADAFNAVLPTLGTLDGGGTLDAKNNMDFNMVATFQSGLVGNASAGNALGKLTGGGVNCKNGGTKVPFRIEGTTANPRFLPDTSGIAANLLKSQLGCAGGALGGFTQGQNPADVINQFGGLFGKKKKP